MSTQRVYELREQLRQKYSAIEKSIENIYTDRLQTLKNDVIAYDKSISDKILKEFSKIHIDGYIITTPKSIKVDFLESDSPPTYGPNESSFHVRTLSSFHPKRVKLIEYFNALVKERDAKISEKRATHDEIRGYLDIYGPTKKALDMVYNYVSDK